MWWTDIMTNNARRLLFAALLTCVTFAGVTACTSSNEPSATAVRTVLGQAAPTNAPGQDLYLEEVIIPPGLSLTKHIHEGTQVANVRSGTLTYTIESGDTVINRADGTTESVEGPAVVELNAGDWIVEEEDLVHFGANEGTEPVTVVLAVLVREGAGRFTPVP